MIAQRALTSSLRAGAAAAAAPSSSRSLATSSFGRQVVLRAASARPQPSSTSPLFPRRNASSSSSSGTSSSEAPNPIKAVTSSNDSLWAISSVLVFGALFVYLTSPTGKGHAKGHAPTPHKKDDDFPTHDEAFENLQKTEDQSDSHLAGNKALAERAHAPDSQGAPTQKKTKDAPTKSDNTTFQHGVAAAKDGDHISDPKKVVAAAAAAKQDKANKSNEKKETKAVEKEGQKNEEKGEGGEGE